MNCSCWNIENVGCCLDFIILVKGDTCYDIYMGEVITKYNSIYSFIRCHNCFFLTVFIILWFSGSSQECDDKIRKGEIDIIFASPETLVGRPILEISVSATDSWCHCDWWIPYDNNLVYIFNVMLHTDPSRNGHDGGGFKYQKTWILIYTCTCIPTLNCLAPKIIESI